MKLILKIAVVTCILLNLYMVFKPNNTIGFDYDKVQQSINTLNKSIELNKDSIGRDTFKLTTAPINK